MSSNADPGFNGYVVLYWSGRGCIANTEIQLLSLWGVDSKCRNTETQQLSLRPSSGPKCPPLKNGHLGPRSVGPPDSWAPDILHISDKYKKLPKIIISRQFQHLNPEKFEQISLLM